VTWAGADSITLSAAPVCGGARGRDPAAEWFDVARSKAYSEPAPGTAGTAHPMPQSRDHTGNRIDRMRRGEGAIFAG
jgi:hypothetical protein